jgi:mannose-6-phosphate isomerase-like protein (cupin superfamily)
LNPNFPSKQVKRTANPEPTISRYRTAQPIMDDEARQAMASMKMPRRPINFVSAKSGEILKLGHITCRIMEDGSRTDNRIGSAEFTLPPNTAGPPAHWHEMHDETFLVTQGMVRVRLDLPFLSFFLRSKD